VKELKSLFPETRLKVGDLVIQIRPFPLKKMADVFEHLELFNFVLSSYASGAVTSILGATQYALANKGEKAMGAILGILTISTGLEADTLLELDYDIVTQLFVEVLEANRDFFRKFLPTAKELIVGDLPAAATPPAGEPELVVLSEKVSP
jgi:hypothetical protein